MQQQKIAHTDHSVIEEIRNRWSPRAFSSKSVEEDKLLKVLEAARWAPSSRNEQPWRFIIARKGEEHYERLFAALNEHNQEWAHTAPVLGASIAVIHHDYKNRENLYRQHDLGLAMGNFLAQATHEGLAVHQMAGIKPEVVVENFDIDKEKFEVVAMFAFGYQDENRLEELDDKYREAEYKTRSRKDLSELIFGANWGKNPDWLK